LLWKPSLILVVMLMRERHVGDGTVADTRLNHVQAC
jgi:hypothetical protein